MDPLFVRGPSLILRMIVLVTLSLVLMTVDHRLGYLETVRSYLSVVVLPLQYVIHFPVKAAQWLSTSLETRTQLLEENDRFRTQNLQLQVTMQKYEDLRSENRRLRHLLKSSVKVGEQILVAEVLAVVDSIDPSTRKMEIDKGWKDNVFTGQPILDAHGVMGQVIRVGPFSSIIMLITDTRHALHVQVVRTGQRAVAEGMGAKGRLNLINLPNNANIKIGDLLVTSGLDNTFPAGYPVGKVVEFDPDIAQSYAQVEAIPIAMLEHNREVLLVWTAQDLQRDKSEQNAQTLSTCEP